MNKRDARKEAYANTRTWGELRKLVEALKMGDLNKKSRVNKSFTVGQFIELFADVGGNDDEYPVSRNSDILIVTNILRECL